MTEFQASNGVNVRWNVDPDLPGLHDGPLVVRISEREAAALREFFQHERDEARGLWRSLSDPTWTAVRRNTCIYFQNEDHERSFHFVPKLEASIKSWSTDLQALAHEYIEAHPERKPWHGAKPGEVWIIREGDAEQTAARAGMVNERMKFEPVNNITRHIDVDDPRIADARRIWPEDAS